MMMLIRAIASIYHSLSEQGWPPIESFTKEVSGIALSFEQIIAFKPYKIPNGTI